MITFLQNKLDQESRRAIFDKPSSIAVILFEN